MLLALDTSTRTTGLALYDGEQVISETIWTSNDFHTVELAPAIVEAIQKSGKKIDKVEAVAVAIGPGSFTGLRIGLAMAKGIALARHLPIIGIPSLDILAYAQPLVDLPLAAVLRAGRGRLAIDWYRAGKKGWISQNKLAVTTAEELVEQIEEPTLVAGELDDDERHILKRKKKLIDLTSPAHSVRRPSFLAELGWRRWQAGQVDDPAALTPIYIHHHDPIPA
ncbi:MAG TPA: tRNA (adenosine(37)-N6)-threonylcarbamoyltransferase complex dimerization subunit type 1 TsaB [Anaerolineales bacterium]|nr:tRNA (adenosine(37)-N6)-threonylcarbamoyltransferase complex dimerization subunit type 1 TsaB [Anaerolineales bacterium]